MNNIDPMILGEIDEVLARAKQKHPEKYHDRHHAYAILLEEVEEVWAEVKHPGPKELYRKELLQVIAVCIRTLEDIE